MTRTQAYEAKKNRDRTGKTKHTVCKAKKPVLDGKGNVAYLDCYVLVLKSYTP